MSQGSNTISKARVYYTAKSLMPGSTFMVCAIAFSTLASLVAAFVFQVPFLFSALTMACSMGLGHMTALYQNSERRGLVPGMNETCAAVAIGFTMLLWLINSAVIWPSIEWVPEAYGITFSIICFALWLGWGERRIFHFLFCLFVGLFVLIATPDGPSRLYNFYSELSIGSRSLVAIVFGLGGVCMIWRFWMLTTSGVSPIIFKQKKDLISFLTGSQEQNEDAALGEKSSPAILPTSLFTRLQWLLYGRVYWNRFYYGWGLLSVGLILSILVWARGHVEATAGFAMVASLVLMLIPMFGFLVRLPQVFRRLWISGLADDRAKTARIILKLTIWRTLVASIIVFALLLIQAPFTADWYVTILFMMLSGLSLSGIALWVTAKWYVFLSTKASFLTLLFIGIAASFFALAPVSIELILELNKVLQSFGLAYSLIGIGALTSLIWTVCVYDASNSLGHAMRLMECEASTIPGSVFNPESRY